MPRLLAAIPILASLDIARSLAFFERLGFKTKAWPEHSAGVAARDGIHIHFWLCSDASIPKAAACRIEVEGIDELFNEMSACGVIHPNGRLENKPWGVREFAIVDIDGSLVTFQQQLP